MTRGYDEPVVIVDQYGSHTRIEVVYKNICAITSLSRDIPITDELVDVVVKTRMRQIDAQIEIEDAYNENS